MITVVAFVRLIPKPPALVETKNTWYAAKRVFSSRVLGDERVNNVRDFSCWN